MKNALEKFEKWYQECLESGISPEEIVEQVGEMKLLVNQEQIDAYEEGMRQQEFATCNAVAEVDKDIPSAEIQWTEYGAGLCLPHGTKLYSVPFDWQDEILAELRKALGTDGTVYRNVEAMLKDALKAEPSVHMCNNRTKFHSGDRID